MLLAGFARRQQQLKELKRQRRRSVDPEPAREVVARDDTAIDDPIGAIAHEDGCVEGA